MADRDTTKCAANAGAVRFSRMLAVCVTPYAALCLLGGAGWFTVISTAAADATVSACFLQPNRSHVS